jgi:predicted N-acyltransferase
MTFELSSCSSANCIPEQAYGLVNSCFSDPKWLSAFEGYSGIVAQPCHLIANSNGSTQGFLPAYVESKSLCGTLRDRLLGRLSEVPFFQNWGTQNALVCTSPWGFSSGIECLNDDRGTVFESLINHLDVVARTRKLDFSAFTFVPESAHELRQALQGRGYARIVTGPTTILDLKWESFNGYVSALPNTKMRSVVRRERKKAGRLSFEWFEDDNLETTRYDYRPLYKILMELYNNTYYKHNGKKSLLKDAFLKNLWRIDHRNLRLCVARLGHKVLSFALLRVFGSTAHALMIGRDYRLNDDYYSYFNVAYYEPIIRGIEEHWRAIHFRPGAYFAKLKRGCRIENLYLYVKGHRLPAKAFLALYVPATRKYFGDKYALPSLLRF